jgi:hypothetical protein
MGIPKGEAFFWSHPKEGSRRAGWEILSIPFS